jgi:trimeric autotransporter adhesin
MRLSNKGALPRLVMKYAVFLVLIGSLSGCANFFVGPQLTSISIGPPNPTVSVGHTQQMDAIGVYDDNSRRSITNESDWSGSDTTVVTVSSSGLITGVSLGTATISAYDLGYSASATVTITDANLVSISVIPTSASINSGQSQQFTAIGLLQTGHTVDLTRSVTWSSSSTSVATIDGYGLVVGASVSSASTTAIQAQLGSITSNVATLTVN